MYGQLGSCGYITRQNHQPSKGCTLWQNIQLWFHLSKVLQLVLPTSFVNIIHASIFTKRLNKSYLLSLSPPNCIVLNFEACRVWDASLGRFAVSEHCSVTLGQILLLRRYANILNAFHLWYWRLQIAPTDQRSEDYIDLWETNFAAVVLHF